MKVTNRQRSLHRTVVVHTHTHTFSKQQAEGEWYINKTKLNSGQQWAADLHKYPLTPAGMHIYLLICGLAGSIQAAGPAKQGPVLKQKGAAVRTLFLGGGLWVKNIRVLFTQWMYNFAVKDLWELCLYLFVPHISCSFLYVLCNHNVCDF